MRRFLHFVSESTFLVWTDVKEQIPLSGLKFVESLYGSKGGIEFTTSDNIVEGNTVLAIKDDKDRIMWSWHIWVTGLDYDQSIQLTNHNGDLYDIMPVNLGWCSNGGEVKYYERKECKVKFTQKINNNQEEGYSQTIKIIQEPHVAVPMGNNTYYQWGRKDPFVGSDERYGNKEWYYEYNGDWTSIEWGGGSYKKFNEGDDPSNRPYTKDIIGELIQNPNKFDNPRRSGYVL